MLRAFLSLLPLLLLLAIPARVQGEDPRIKEGWEDHLDPEEGEFTRYRGGPFVAAFMEVLLGESDRRCCQMVFLPTFDPERVVYTQCSGRAEPSGPHQIVAKSLKRKLGEVISEAEKALPRGPSRDSQADLQVVLGKVKEETLRWERQVSSETYTLLDEAWMSMLLEVRARKTGVGGWLDGTTIHVSHFQTGRGWTSGSTWSPPDGTLVGEFIDLGEALERFARGELTEQELAIRAESLLWRIRKEGP